MVWPKQPTKIHLTVYIHYGQSFATARMQKQFVKKFWERYYNFRLKRDGIQDLIVSNSAIGNTTM